MLTFTDYAVVVIYGIAMLVLGFIAKTKVKTVEDYFAGGHGVPWWIAAISHHVAGYSAVVFVGFASQAYNVGFSIWSLFAIPTFCAMLIGAFVWAPRWAKLKVFSAVEYLEERYNNLIRQVIAWGGIGVKFIDEGVKLYALSVVVNVCTGWPIGPVIISVGLVTIIYVLIGGLWATMLTDMAQFIVQVGFTVFLVPLVLNAVGGWDAMWEQLPPENGRLFSSAIPAEMVFVYLIVATLSYNGGTWGLAQRFYSIGKPRDAQKAALLSALLFLVYPIVLFIPAWAAPILLDVKEIASPEHAYILVAAKVLQGLAPGLIGLLVISMFSATMSMISSDLNSLAAVITKDIYQRNFNPNAPNLHLLRVGLVATTVLGFLMIASAMLVLSNPSMERAFNVTIQWFGALLGPVTIPLLFGMLSKRSSWRGALASVIAGLATFAILRPLTDQFAIYTGCELFVSFLVFFGEGYFFGPTEAEKEKIARFFRRLEETNP
ncbi:MAG TPA: Na+:solute symporter [bacterium]|nr:Na+:solute symporter [bacterium]HQL63106.1 Na+:solute symporter [bacterium]